jgi:hypothetical protein
MTELGKRTGHPPAMNGLDAFVIGNFPLTRS